MEDDATEDKSICWTSLKDLTFRYYNDNWDTGLLWSWMWKRCSQVERLYVQKIDKSTPSLVQAMLDYMHNLEEITIGDDTYPVWAWNPEDKMEDDVVAALLSGSRRGWISVSVMWTAEFGPGAMNALAMHYSTLEDLYIHVNYCISDDVVQAVRSCPHLYILCYTDLCNGNSVLDGEAFIDLDPDTGLLKPWLCEGSLRVLEVKFFGIPRLDLEKRGGEAYPGRGREIQRQVYDRIARLTRLETLTLGDRFGGARNDCLEMSLESGLDKLSGLKSLKKLDVRRLDTKIGIKEVQWMVENWPKLMSSMDLVSIDGTWMR
ncbi:MAG: hypothetical protein J3Q66DRAFT_58554 [Benniella sp.]|nr:MAG: hypothetical protein J3Q66DRAFT_58554 [Benniella sp.]